MDIFDLRAAFEYDKMYELNMTFSDLLQLFGRDELWEFLDRVQPDPEVSSPKIIASELPCLNLDELKKVAVIEALKRAKWSQKNAAVFLGISPRQVNTYVANNKITHPSWKKNVEQKLL